MDRTVDVVVIGLGAAALSAAITAHDAGSEVLLLEKAAEREAGGNTRVSGNVWYHPTSVEEAVVYLSNLCGDHPLPEILIRTWAEEIARNTEFVQSLGDVEIGLMERDYEHPDVPGHESDRGYWHIQPSWGHSRLWLHLKAAVESRGIEILYETPAQELIQDRPAGEITGVRAGGLLIGARRGVVIASGGFANNPQMARDFLRLPKSHPWGSPANTGDGIKLAQSAGADLWHMGQFTGRPGFKTPEFRSCFHVMFPVDGYIYVDTAGRRFMDETTHLRHGKVMRGGRLVPPFTDIFHCVFDEKTRVAGPIVAPFETEPMSWNKIVEGYTWSDDNSVEIERGWIARAGSVRELGSAIGLDPGALERTVARYNEFCAAGQDADLDRPAASLIPLDEPPYYSWQWAPMVVFTGGGPRKDERARVLSTTGDPIPRLYCAGEVSATYSWGLSGGQMIGDAMAFGRIAGRNAAAETPRSDQAVAEPALT